MKNVLQFATICTVYLDMRSPNTLNEHSLNVQYTYIFDIYSI